MSGEGRYEFVDRVTSDLTFAVWAPSLDALFATAAQALLAATVEDPGGVRPRERRTLSLEEPDLELLLLRFLNELVYLRDAQGLLLRAESIRVLRDGGARLEAALGGESIDPDRHHLATEVKAATAHGLHIEPTGDPEPAGWRVQVTLDV